ncbi:MAG: hypothetical protein ACR2OO_01375 [Thermomicrobiales bacterium]
MTDPWDVPTTPKRSRRPDRFTLAVAATIAIVWAILIPLLF